MLEEIVADKVCYGVSLCQFHRLSRSNYHYHAIQRQCLIGPIVLDGYHSGFEYNSDLQGSKLEVDAHACSSFLLNGGNVREVPLLSWSTHLSIKVGC